MNYLLDTNHWSYLQRRHPSVLGRLQSLPGDATLYMPVIAQAELLVGVELAAEGRRKQELRALYETAIRDSYSRQHGYSQRHVGGGRAVCNRVRPVATEGTSRRDKRHLDCRNRLSSESHPGQQRRALPTCRWVAIRRLDQAAYRARMTTEVAREIVVDQLQRAR